MKKLSPKLVGEFIDFVRERYLIYRRRHVQRMPPPWTEDPILQTYKFTNVYREDDRVTKWIHQNWLQPHKDDPDLWFALVVARIVNWPPSLSEVGYPVPWRPADFIEHMWSRASAKAQLFTGAYMINQSIPGGKGVPKHEYVAKFVLDPMWGDRRRLRPRDAEPLEDFHRRLAACKGFGSFMAAQVVADMKHAPVLTHAPDWGSFAASGPGSKRGLNLVCNEAPTSPWNEAEWKGLLLELARATNAALFERDGILPSELDAQNVQNCLCEFSKYVRGYSRTKFKEYQECM